MSFLYGTTRGERLIALRIDNIISVRECSEDLFDGKGSVEVIEVELETGGVYSLYGDLENIWDQLGDSDAPAVEDGPGYDFDAIDDEEADAAAAYLRFIIEEDDEEDDDDDDDPSGLTVGMVLSAIEDVLEVLSGSAWKHRISTYELSEGEVAWTIERIAEGIYNGRTPAPSREDLSEMIDNVDEVAEPFYGAVRKPIRFVLSNDI